MGTIKRRKMHKNREKQPSGRKNIGNVIQITITGLERRTGSKTPGPPIPINGKGSFAKGGLEIRWVERQGLLPAVKSIRVAIGL